MPEIGSQFPAATLFEGLPDKAVKTDELMAGKKIAIFGVPGAFTPGCSKTHLPGYIADFQKFKDKGVDEIVCVSVNDPFVMAAWGEAHGATDKVRMLADTQAELAKVEEDLAGANQVLAQRKNQFAQTDLFAPVDGVVKNVRITTKGGVVRAGEEVMQIVPLDDDLVVEAKLKPADIAFVKPGLSAQVKIDAYDYTIYGALNGTVTYISADTLEENLRQGEMPYYRVQIRTTGKVLKNRPDEPMEIQPGMTATVEIKTGVNTVLKYLTKPLVKTFSESLGER